MFFKILLKSNCIPFKSNTIYIKKFLINSLTNNKELSKNILYLSNKQFETINSNYLNNLLFNNNKKLVKINQFFYEYHNLNLSYKHYILFKDKPFVAYNIEVKNLSSIINNKVLFFDLNANMI